MRAEAFPVEVKDCTMDGDALDFVVTVTVTYRVEKSLRGLPDHVRAQSFAGPLADAGSVA